MSTRLVPTLLATLLIGATLFPIEAFGEPQPSPAPTAIAASTGQTEADTDDQVCSSAPKGYARCYARVRTDRKIQGRIPASARAAASQNLAARAAQPAGGPLSTLGNGGAYDPSYLQSAYNLASAASSAGHGQTVAIV